VLVHDCVHALFSIAVVLEISNAIATLFWTDRWINGQSISDLASQVMALVPQMKKEQESSYEAVIVHGLGIFRRPIC
jgi:hypothetical protein